MDASDTAGACEHSVVCSHPVASVVVNTPMLTCKEVHNFGNVLLLRQMCTGCYTSFEWHSSGSSDVWAHVTP